MTKELSKKRKVEVAKDVIKQLKAGKYKATRGEYLYFTEGYTPPTKDTDLQSIVKKRGVKCAVCAIGAIVASKARLFNEVPVEAGEDDPWNAAARSEAFKCFGKQSQTIERHFEGWTFNAELDDLEPKERLIAIMQNIIHNRGVFVPEKLRAS